MPASARAPGGSYNRVFIMSSAHAPVPPRPSPPTPAQRSPLRAAVAIAVAAAAAVGMYFWFARQAPLPPWMDLPDGFKVLLSRYAPDEPEAVGERPQYLLRLGARARPDDALREMSRSVLGFEWEPGPRTMTDSDLFQRAAWPQWVRGELMPAASAGNGRILIGARSSERVFIMAFPRNGGSVVEVVHTSALP